MTPAELQALPDSGALSLPLQALWWAARGEWDRAHEAAQAGQGRDSDWVHAYLHRVEGDEANAGYWYSRAGREFPVMPLDAEWRGIATELLQGLDPAPLPS